MCAFVAVPVMQSLASHVAESASGQAQLEQLRMQAQQLSVTLAARDREVVAHEQATLAAVAETELLREQVGCVRMWHRSSCIFDTCVNAGADTVNTLARK